MALQARIARDTPPKSAVRAEDKKSRTAADHFAMVKQLPCCATGSPGPNDGHHLMRGVDRGTGLKSAGRYTIPLHPAIHKEITPHGDPEAILMERYGVDARALADALWAQRGNLDAMERVVGRAHQEARRRIREKESRL